MRDWVQECRTLGVDSRIVRCGIGIELEEVEEIGGQSLQEFDHLNQLEESGLDRWIRFVCGRDYEGDEVMLGLLVELYKKLDRLEKRLLKEDCGMLKLAQKTQVHHIGHQILCVQDELVKGKIYYGRIDLPVFPYQVIPLYLQMLTENIGRVIKMGASHTRSYDSYVVECERMEIREKRKEEKL